MSKEKKMLLCHFNSCKRIYVSGSLIIIKKNMMVALMRSSCIRATAYDLRLCMAGELSNCH